MKRICLITVLLILTSALLADFSISFTPLSLTVNRFSTFDIDPVNPLNQPNIATLNIINNGGSTKFDLDVQAYWNNTALIAENGILLKSREELPAGGSILLSNSELISNSGGVHFTAVTNVDILATVKNNNTLKEALMAGYFPDGKLQIRVRIREANKRSWQEPPAVFTLTIKNASAIHLVSPGTRINQVPPKLSYLPLLFNWHSYLAEFNKEILVIKEFPPSQMPQSQNVEYTGKVVHTEQNAHSGFSEYLPLNDGCYYAWQVYSPQYTGSNPLENTPNNENAPRISSPWYVFQYIKDDQNEQQSQEVNTMLQILSNPLIMNLLLSGYTATGEVILDGRVYSGQEALDIIESLKGKALQIEIKD